MHSKSTTDDDLGLFYMNPISTICVHPVNLWFDFQPSREQWPIRLEEAVGQPFDGVVG